MESTVDSSSASSASDDDDLNTTEETEMNSTNAIGNGWSLGVLFRNLLHFDSLNLTSTTWRRERMLSSIQSITDSESDDDNNNNNSQDQSSSSSSPSKLISYIPHYGINVCFIPHKFHYTPQELEPYRMIGDPEMDALLQYLSSSSSSSRSSCGCGAFDDVISHVANEYHNHKGDGATEQQPQQQCQSTSLSPPIQFYKHYYETIPSWVDYDQIQRGINVFLAYLPAAGCALFYRSLVGGFSIPKVVEVLVATRYLVPKQMMKMKNTKTKNNTTTTTQDGCDDGAESAEISGQSRSSSRSSSTISSDGDRQRSLERLIDTGGFLACCFAPPSTTTRANGDHRPPIATTSASSLRPGGKGWEAALRVRVLHAKVRRSLLLLSNNNNSWDTVKNGIPINQEDMTATLLAFSVNVLIGIEIVSGRPLPECEQRDYLALWRYLGWLLGVDTVERMTTTTATTTTRGEKVARYSSSSNGDGSDTPLVPIDPCGPRKIRNIDHDDRDQLDDDNLDLEHSCNNNDDDASNINDDHGDSIIHSYATLESMILHLLHPEQSSRDLVSHLLSLRQFSLFRSEVCRVFLGGPLSDELDIPTSSVNWKGLGRSSSSRESICNLVEYLGVKFCLYFFLLILRWYTVLTMTVPWIRRWAIGWHAYLETKFLKGWRKMNGKRMSKAAAAASATGIAVPVTSSAVPPSSTSHCPFSMIMAPDSTV